MGTLAVPVAVAKNPLGRHLGQTEDDVGLAHLGFGPLFPSGPLEEIEISRAHPAIHLGSFLLGVFLHAVYGAQDGLTSNSYYPYD